ncbi:diguanylate cyclase [Thiocapsa imhoffii]|uniref:diguanylate cyclase n=1 Tax=Thiocapsa imhoffii TaxID=382777 RepID=UPI001902E918
MLFCALTGGLAASGIVYDYSRTQELARQRLEHTTDLIAQWIIGAFHASDYLLRDLSGLVDTEILQHPHPDPQAQRRLTERLIEKKDSLPHAFLVGAFDRNCIVTHTNAIVGFDASERSYCRALRDDPSAEVFVTPAYVNNLDRINVTQARRLESEMGDFRGMVAIGVDLDFFSAWLDRIDVGRAGSVTIVDSAGLLLARKPMLPEELGQRVVEPRFLEAFASEDEFSAIAGPSPIDGVVRLFGIRQVPDLPFVVVVGEASRELFSDWFWRAVVSTGMIVLLWLLSVLFLRNHLLLVRQRSQLVRVAHFDPLTGIFNRRHFEHLADLAFKHARRAAVPLSLLLLDLDHFKPINDQHGHATGDRALLAFVEASLSVLRETDLFSRWGGDEFVILIEGDEADARILAQRLRAAWARIELRNDQGAPLSLTASIGIAGTHPAVPGELDSLEKLLAQADAALYREKQANR